MFRRSFPWLEEENLYFARLVRDIREYCLRPYLEHTLGICGEQWHEPILVGKFPVIDRTEIQQITIDGTGHCYLIDQSQLQKFPLWNPSEIEYYTPIFRPYLLMDYSTEQHSLRFSNDQETWNYSLLTMGFSPPQKRQVSYPFQIDLDGETSVEFIRTHEGDLLGLTIKGELESHYIERVEEYLRYPYKVVFFAGCLAIVSLDRSFTQMMVTVYRLFSGRST